MLQRTVRKENSAKEGKVPEETMTEAGKSSGAKAMEAKDNTPTGTHDKQIRMDEEVVRFLQAEDINEDPLPHLE